MDGNVVKSHRMREQCRTPPCGGKWRAHIAAFRSVLPTLVMLAAAVTPAAAQNATWNAVPGTGNFNTATNWTPAQVPTGTAFFDTSTITSLTFSANTTIGGWTFNPGASNYTFTTPTNRTLTFNGAGIIINGGSLSIDNNNNLIFNNSSSAGNAIIANTAAIGNDRNLTFNDTSTAGNAIITNNNRMNFNDTSTAGNATITNNDRLNFNDTSTASAATIINNDELTFDNSSTAATATITNNSGGVVVFDRTSTAGTATITNNSGGEVVFDRNSTAGSATITNSGTLNFRGTSTGGSAAITNNLGGQVNFSTSRGPANDGRISAGSIAGAGNFLLGDNELTVGGNNQTTTVSGIISDTGVGPPGGSIVKTGTGTLTLSGINTYAGSTTINNGTLALSGTGSIAASSGVDVANSAGVFDISGTTAGATIRSLSGVAGSSVTLGNQTLTLSNAAGTFGGEISGTGGLTLNAGTETLTGTNTYTGATTINSGTLLVDGSIASSSGLTANASGTLGGTGTLPATSINGGILSPGPLIGTLNVQGNLSFTPASTYQVDISPTTGDRTNVTGTATLTGTVHVIAQPGSYPSNTAYTILTAAGGLSGAFSALDFGSAFLCACLSYDANNVYLQIVSTGLTFAGVGQTPNQVATGAAVEGLGAGNPIYDVVVLGSAEQARTAFDLLSGEIHTSAASAMLDESHYVRDAVTARLRQSYGNSFGPLTTLSPGGPLLAYAAKADDHPPFAFSSPRTAAPADRIVATWAQMIGSWGKHAGDGNAAALNRSAGGFLSGLDTTYGDRLRLGLVGGYTRSWLTVGDRSSSGAVDNYHVGLYGGGQFGALGVRTGVAHTWHDIDTSRSMIFSGGEGCCASVFSDMVKASYRARTAQAFGEVGFGFFAGRTAVEPFANAAYVNVDTDGFTESGGAASLTAAPQSNDAVFTTLGTRASVTQALAGGAWLTTFGTLGWRHGSRDVTPTMSMTLQAAEPLSTSAAFRWPATRRWSKPASVCALHRLHRSACHIAARLQNGSTIIRSVET